MGTARATHEIGDALAPLSGRARLLGAIWPESRSCAWHWVVLVRRSLPQMNTSRRRRVARGCDPPMPGGFLVLFRALWSIDATLIFITSSRSPSIACQERRF